MTYDELYQNAGDYTGVFTNLVLEKDINWNVVGVLADCFDEVTCRTLQHRSFNSSFRYRRVEGEGYYFEQKSWLYGKLRRLIQLGD